jgi:hypothetical protein
LFDRTNIYRLRLLRPTMSAEALISADPADVAGTMAGWDDRRVPAHVGYAIQGGQQRARISLGG